MTIRRGEVLVKDGEFFGKKGIGKFMKRTLA
jgi:preprotein translocase subunit SecG